MTDPTQPNESPLMDDALLTALEEPAKQPPFAERFAHFMTRTPTIYASAPLSILTDRGIENRLLDSLLAFIPEGCIIAGGFVTQVILEEKNATDIDLFFTSEKAFRDTVALLTKPPEEDGGWAWKGYAPKDGAVFDLDKLGDTRFITFTHPKRPALQLLRNLTIHSSDDENILVFSKVAGEGPGADRVIVVVNLDPHATRETMIHLDLPSLGLEWHDGFTVHDEITGEDWHWGQHNYVRLDPGHEPAHVLTIRSAE